MEIQHLIIGAGPAGLAVAGRLSAAGIPFEVLEQTGQTGHSWHRHYDRLHLHTVKKWSSLPLLDFPAHYPLYVPRQLFADYLEDYARHFRIRPRFGEKVTSVSKHSHGWQVTCASGNQWTAGHVVIATGINRVPHIPVWKGQDRYEGKILHSIHYKNPRTLGGKKVLVIGMGNTGAEIALDLAEHGIPVCLSVRGEISLVPRDLHGRPVQVTAKKLEKWPFGLGDWLGSQIRKIYFGNLSRYGLNISGEHPARLLREKGKTPVIDIGTIQAIREGKITVAGGIEHFTSRGVRFADGTEDDFDHVVLATGYKSAIEEFVEKGAELLDPFGHPMAPVATGYHSGLYFVGFDNYKLGGILGTIRTDSETVVQAIASAGS